MLFTSNTVRNSAQKPQCSFVTEFVFDKTFRLRTSYAIFLCVLCMGLNINSAAL